MLRHFLARSRRRLQMRWVGHASLRSSCADLLGSSLVEQRLVQLSRSAGRPNMETQPRDLIVRWSARPITPTPPVAGATDARAAKTRLATGWLYLDGDLRNAGKG